MWAFPSLKLPPILVRKLLEKIAFEDKPSKCWEEVGMKQSKGDRDAPEARPRGPNNNPANDHYFFKCFICKFFLTFQITT